MNKILKILYILFSFLLFFYVSLPNFEFPSTPPGSLESKEPADVETPLRRAYFTDLTRAEVLEWYMAQFRYSTFMSIPLPTYLLNYPPEESQMIIRDQTRSTFLQEIVHPFRETVFINGYEPAPKDDENKIVIDGKRYRQKIIVKFVPTNLPTRLLIGVLTILSIPLLISAFWRSILSLKKSLKRNRITNHE